MDDLCLCFPDCTYVAEVKHREDVKPYPVQPCRGQPYVQIELALLVLNCHHFFSFYGLEIFLLSFPPPDNKKPRVLCVQTGCIGV